MKIDMFTHAVPESYKKALGKVAPHLEEHTDLMPTLFDMDRRFRIMDGYDDIRQVVTLALTASLVLNDPALAVEFARRANDSMAELVNQYPERLAAGVASIPTTHMDAALGELERAVEKLKLKGVQLFTPIKGSPVDLTNSLPLFEKMAAYDLPIWIHPVKPIDRSGYKKYFIDHVFGWPFESVAAMTSLVLDGLFERFPRVKVIVHHCGATAPFFDGRIAEAYYGSSTFHGMKHEGGLTRPLIDYFKMFYGDTALSGGTAGLMCGYEFFHADHMLFATDMPYDAELGARTVRLTLAAVERMNISQADKEMIYCGNAKRLLKL